METVKKANSNFSTMLPSSVFFLFCRRKQGNTSLVSNKQNFIAQYCLISKHYERLATGLVQIAKLGISLKKFKFAPYVTALCVFNFIFRDHNAPYFKNRLFFSIAQIREKRFLLRDQMTRNSASLRKSIEHQVNRTPPKNDYVPHCTCNQPDFP